LENAGESAARRRANPVVHLGQEFPEKEQPKKTLRVKILTRVSQQKKHQNQNTKWKKKRLEQRGVGYSLMERRVRKSEPDQQQNQKSKEDKRARLQVTLGKEGKKVGIPNHAGKRKLMPQRQRKGVTQGGEEQVEGAQSPLRRRGKKEEGQRLRRRGRKEIWARPDDNDSEHNVGGSGKKLGKDSRKGVRKKGKKKGTMLGNTKEGGKETEQNRVNK